RLRADRLLDRGHGSARIAPVEGVAGGLQIAFGVCEGRPGEDRGREAGKDKPSHALSWTMARGLIWPDTADTQWRARSAARPAACCSDTPAYSTCRAAPANRASGHSPVARRGGGRPRNAYP